jgi:hypothetical protein
LLEASIAIEAALCVAGRSGVDIDGGGGWGAGPETGLPELHGALAPSHHSSHPRTPTETSRKSSSLLPPFTSFQITDIDITEYIDTSEFNYKLNLQKNFSFSTAAYSITVDMYDDDVEVAKSLVAISALKVAVFKAKFLLPLEGKLLVYNSKLAYVYTFPFNYSSFSFTHILSQ